MQKCCLLESGFVIEPVVLDTKCYQIHSLKKNLVITTTNNNNKKHLAL